MDLSDLRLFVAVAEEGHFTRAAERLGRSQPALTHRVARLEEALGVRLFERTPRGARLTPAGESLLRDARRLLADAEDARRRARRAAGLADDVLRVGFDLVEFGALGPMPSLLGAFRARFPDAEVRLSTAPAEDLERDLAEDRLDIAFVLGPTERAGLRFHPILRGAFALLLPAAPANPGAGLPWLLPRLRARDEAALVAGPGARVARRGAEVAALAGLVAAGEGAAVLPAPLAAAGGGTVATPLAGAPPWTFGLAWREGGSPWARLAERQIRRMVREPVVLER